MDINHTHVHDELPSSDTRNPLNHKRGDSVALVSSKSFKASNPSTSPSALIRQPKKNRTREREKIEKLKLEALINLYQDQLVALQRRQKERIELTDDQIYLAQAWRQVAHQTDAARKLAEYQNRSLRSECLRQASVIEQIVQTMNCSYINKAYRSLVLRTSLSRSGHRGYATWSGNTSPDNQLQAFQRPAIDFDDKVLLNMYLGELDEVYEMTDQVLDDCALDLESDEPSTVVIRSRLLPGESLEVFEATQISVLPIAFARVQGEAWTIISSFYPNRIGDSAVMGKASVRRSDFGLSVSFAMRRYCEEPNGRVIVAWRTLTIGDGAFAEMDADETGWLLARPSKLSGDCLTVLQSCVRIVPMFAASASSTDAQRFTRELMRCGDHDTAAVAASMQRALQHPSLQDN